MIDRTLSVLDHYHLLDDAEIKAVEVKILCPFHEERTPSCGIDLDKELWFCHGCEQGGTLIDFVKRLEQVNDLQALQVISRIEAGNAQSTARAVKISLVRADDPVDSETARQQAKDFFFSLPKPPWELIGYHYLRNRGFEPRTLQRFDVRTNMSSEYPIALPIYDNGRFQGYMTRSLDDRPDKYRMSKGMRKSEVLSGKVKPGAIVLLVEGQLDRMRAWQNGWRDVVTGLNWALSDIQLEKLAPASAVICGLDNDDAGERGYRVVKDGLKGKPVIRYPFPPWVKDHGEMPPAEFRVGMSKALRQLDAA